MGENSRVLLVVVLDKNTLNNSIAYLIFARFLIIGTPFALRISTYPLIKVENNNVMIAEYVYNGLNQRIIKIIPAEIRTFHYDLQDHLIPETSESGGTLVEYFYIWIWGEMF